MTTKTLNTQNQLDLAAVLNYTLTNNTDFNSYLAYKKLSESIDKKFNRFCQYVDSNQLVSDWFDFGHKGDIPTFDFVKKYLL